LDNRTDYNKYYLPAGKKIDKTGGLKLKYQWNYAYCADEIAYIKTKPLDKPPVSLPLTEATHSLKGEISDKLASSDDVRITITPHDVLSFSFANPTAVSVKERMFILKVEGSYTPGASERLVKENAPDEPELLPKVFAFDQNYPNPFNPVTTFSFSLPRSSDVKLEIYNILGRKVTTLIDKPYVAGYYKYNWHSSNISSGIYLARFKAGDFTLSRKVMVLK
jgi:hypothetical protein